MSSILTLTGTINAGTQGWYNTTRVSDNPKTIKVTFPSHEQAAGYIIEDVKIYFTFTGSGKSAQKKMNISFTGTGSNFTTTLTTKGAANDKKTYVSIASDSLNKFKNWLASGGTVITSVDPVLSTDKAHQENSSPYGWYSDNYAKITTAEMKITYTPSSSTISFTSTNATLSKDFGFTINTGDSSYTHDVDIIYGGKTARVLSNVPGGIQSFTVNGATFGSSFPNSTSMGATLQLKTKNGSVELGTTSYAITLVADSSSAPSVSSCSFTTKDNTSVILGNITQLTFNCGASAKYGASIKTYSIKIGNTIVNSSSSSIIMTAPAGSSSKQAYTLTIIDSRGFTATRSYENAIYINPYFNPYLSNISIYRCNSSGTRDDISGEYAKVSYSKNVASLKDKTGDNSVSNVGTVSLTIGGTSREIGADGIVTNATFKVDTSYPVVLTITDSMKRSSTINAELSSSKYLLHFRKNQNSIGIGCAADDVGTNGSKIKIGLPLHLTSSITLNKPLEVAQGGTGASSRKDAFNNIVGLGGTITGDLTTTGALNVNGVSTFTHNNLTIKNSETAPVIRFQKSGDNYYNGAIYFSTANTLVFRNFNGKNDIYENFLLPAPTINSGNVNYEILTTKNYNYTLNKGSQTIASATAFGFLTGGKKQIKLYFPFGLPFNKSVNNVSVSSLKGNIRCNNVYLNRNGTGSFVSDGIEMWQGNDTNTANLMKDQNILYVYMEIPEASSATNNTVLQFDGSITFTLS